MQGELVARNYASALMELAAQEGELEAFGDGFDLVSKLLDEQGRFRLFLETPRIDNEEKKKVLRKAFGEQVPRKFLNFLQLVVDKRRQRLLREMARQYHALLDKKLGREHVEVSVARPLDDASLERLTERLSGILDTNVVPHIRVKPELIGGVVFRSGDIVFDGSVRRRLEDMRRRLLAADISSN
ncbi:MAG: ATP synthase F1 subunit delta [Gemmatimonadota bacterium]